MGKSLFSFALKWTGLWKEAGGWGGNCFSVWNNVCIEKNVWKTLPPMMPSLPPFCRKAENMRKIYGKNGRRLKKQAGLPIKEIKGEFLTTET
ncbi:MAG: hypothetical protein LBP38_05080 [Desulfovibrio sp.]|nr:hypothetical protein [Desulfovibrio sp.]